MIGLNQSVVERISEMAGPSQTSVHPISSAILEFVPFETPEGELVHFYISPSGEPNYVVEAPLPSVWNFPHSRLDVTGVPDSGMHGFVTSHGQNTFKSLASAFEWTGPEIDPASPYNAQDASNPAHDDWLRDNKKGPYARENAKSGAIPLNLQVAVANGKDFSTAGGPPSPKSHSNKAGKPKNSTAAENYKPERFGRAECAYWAKGQCKNGDSCKFLHPLEKDPKSAVAIARGKECAFWAKGQCKNGDNCRFLHIRETVPKPKALNSRVCRFWKQGKCTKGNGCGYDHFE